jgi:peptidoglycan/LPS O-acetylase OafA/YrhL
VSPAARVAELRCGRPPYRPDIDGLRAVAVALVIGYHASPALLPGGFVGVDVFFVISGYLITQLILGLQQGSFTLTGFYRRRVRRIVPALLVVLGACCLFGWFTLLPGEFSWLGKQILWCTPFLANAFFARYTGYSDPGADSNVLLHLWSLGVEEQFYLIWPVLLMFAAAFGVVQRVIIAVLATSLAISAWGAWHAPLVHFYLPGARAWELALGAILAVRAIRVPGAPRAAHAGETRLRPRSEELCALAGLALIAAGAWLLSARNAFPGLWGIVPAGGAALLIGAGPESLVNRRLLGCGPMIWVGKLSYSLYLWHWPLFSFARIVSGRELSPTTRAAIIALAVIAAYVTYRLVETPIRYGPVGRKPVPALLAGLVGFTALGAAIAAERVPGRLEGPAYTAWAAAAGDWSFDGETQVDARTGFTTLLARSGNSRTALFIGDSHLQQYWPRVRWLVDAHPHVARSALFATYTACVPLPGVESLRQPRDCDGFVAYATGLALREDVDTVVFGAFWEVYLLGEYATDHRQGVFSSSDRLRMPLQLDSPATRLAFERFERTIARMVASGRRVFIVLSNPTSPRLDPASRIPARLRLSLHVPDDLPVDRAAVDAADFEAFVAPVMDRLREIAARAGADVLDPRSTLCAGMSCPAIGPDGLPLYVDSNHTRASWARRAASFLDETLIDSSGAGR